MKTRVNLYAPSFHPTLRLLSLPIASSFWLVLLLLMLAIYGYLRVEEQQLSAQQSATVGQLSQNNSLAKILQSELASLKVDPALQQQLVDNQLLLERKQRVLAEIDGQANLKTNGFAPLMMDLARNHQPGVWLSHIGLDGRSVILEGSASESALIPKWLASLGDTQYFSGQEFADTQVYRDSDQQLNFIVASAIGVRSTASAQEKQ
jgi:Tfp pilus assembly protein PilN